MKHSSKVKPTKEAINVIKKLVRYGHKSNANSLYKIRLSRNVNGNERKHRKQDAWDALMLAILTTQQRSTGNNHRAKDLIASGALSWRRVLNQEELIHTEVTGFHYNDQKQLQLIDARAWLNHNWRLIRKHQRSIENVPPESYDQCYAVELEASNFIRSEVRGIGLKQSRNFWQYLGYSVWTIPLDSRIKSIMESDPFKLKPRNLQIEKQYREYELQIINICKSAKTYPCLVDALLFNLEGLIRNLVGLPHN